MMDDAANLRQEIKLSDYEPDFEEISSKNEEPLQKYLPDQEIQNDMGSKELGTLTWTWTPLSRDSLYEANDALVRNVI